MGRVATHRRLLPTFLFATQTVTTPTLATLIGDKSYSDSSYTLTLATYTLATPCYHIRFELKTYLHVYFGIICEFISQINLEMNCGFKNESILKLIFKFTIAGCYCLRLSMAYTFGFWKRLQLGSVRY